VIGRSDPGDGADEVDEVFAWVVEGVAAEDGFPLRDLVGEAVAGGEGVGVAGQPVRSTLSSGVEQLCLLVEVGEEAAGLAAAAGESPGPGVLGDDPAAGADGSAQR
jgi:hypothetical protein